jgi:hypothetical protein
MHKFYVSIYQINYVSEKKMVQITARIFVDDLNKMLGEKYKTTTYLGEKTESETDRTLLQKYVSENLSIKINGKSKGIYFLSKELEGNVLICYLSIKDVPKIKTLEIENKVLLELNDEQQNIVHTNCRGVKKSLLFSGSNAKGMLKY